MSYAQARIDELIQISRKRELTVDEQRECMLRAKQVRNFAQRRKRYAEDLAHRAAKIEQSRQYRRRAHASA